MKKTAYTPEGIIWTMASFLFSIVAAAQDTGINYTKSTTYKVATTTGISAPGPEEAVVTLTYFDGLGRPVRKIAHRQSNSGQDIIVPIEYDAAGRRTRDYLPYPASTHAMDFQGNAVSDAIAYYSTKFGPSEQNPYSEKVIEASPLGRVLEQSAPGDLWKTGNGHTIRFEQQLNATGSSTNPQVKQFHAIAVWDSGRLLYTETIDYPDGSKIYDAGQLFLSVVKDENWTGGKSNTTEEYRNAEGQVVLKRSFNITAADPVLRNYDTYYVYDQFGSLAFVIPPKADGDISTEVMDGLCYQYLYDDQNRLVEKKIPGREQWEFIVYDRLDRIVATGPTVSPFGDIADTGWSVTKYDVFGRPVLTAWLPIAGPITSPERKQLQALRDADDSALNESRSSWDTTTEGINFRYTSVAWPTAGYHALTVNYYDTYAFTGAPTTFADVQEQPVFYDDTNEPKGLATGSWVRILEKSDGIRGDLSYVLYDERGRVTRSHTDNYLGGYTRSDSKLDFAGKILYAVTAHRRLATGDPLTIKDSFTYSGQDRMTMHLHRIGSSGPWTLMSKTDYDEMGQVTSKYTGGTETAWFQKVDYSFNIRGWLTGINDVAHLDESGQPDDLFAFKISYTTTTGEGISGITGPFNGNISETYWRSGSDNVLRKYGYGYDSMNRLERAIYQRPDNVDPTPDSYNEIISYDKNGNIQALKRTGALDNAEMALAIDDLQYAYGSNSNQLLKVTDLENCIHGFADDSDGTDDTVDDYAYDDYGNLVRDQNKKISAIIYNHLNLPVFIQFDIPGNNRIDYIYNALGQKAAKTVTMETIGGVVLTTTEYIGGFQYADTKLMFFPTAEGYVRVVGDKCSYVYNYKDHLGNIRLSYTEDPENPGELVIVEENHYYPYGLKHQNYNIEKWEHEEVDDGLVLASASALEYKYKFNGMEYQEELGLNLYDMDFRDYDPAIGRWTGIDPVTHHSMSPYMAFDGNPAYWADPSGADAYDVAMDLFGKSSTGITTWIHHGNDNYSIGSYVTNEEATFNDLTLSKSGIITSMSNRSGKYVRLFDNKGAQLFFNDPLDKQWLDGMDVGDRLFHNIDMQLMAKFLRNAGPISALDRGIASGYLKLAYLSHSGPADFGGRQLMQYFDIDYGQSEYSGMEGGDGNFFRFGRETTLYNLADAGNFLWGSWMALNGYSNTETQYGAEMNSLFTTQTWDTSADQNAIRNGYYFIYNRL